MDPHRHRRVDRRNRVDLAPRSVNSQARKAARRHQNRRRKHANLHSNHDLNHAESDAHQHHVARALFFTVEISMSDDEFYATVHFSVSAGLVPWDKIPAIQ